MIIDIKKLKESVKKDFEFRGSAICWGKRHDSLDAQLEVGHLIAKTVEIENTVAKIEAIAKLHPDCKVD